METLLRKEIIVSRAHCRIFAMTVCVVLTALGAFIRIPLPFTPVPLTVQTMFVLLTGALLGARLGGMAQAGYLLLGMAGVPVFTGMGGGLWYFTGPTAGYLFGFVPAAMLIAALLRGNPRNPFLVVGAFLAAAAVILTSGAIWLKILLGYGPGHVFTIGVLPFIPGDILKAAAASVIYLRLRPRLGAVL